MPYQAPARELIDQFETVPGMMSRLAGNAFASVLARQNAAEIGGLVEFGVFKGRSAFLLHAFRQPSETLYLVDTKLTQETRERFGSDPASKLFEMDSKVFYAERSGGEGIRGKCRLVHVDGSHTFDNVSGDMLAGEGLLMENGLVILDDFQNPNYPQVQAAFFNYLIERKSALRPFLIGANKCFICFEKAHPFWLQYAMTQFLEDMRALGAELQLSKTDRHAAFDVVTFRGRKPDEDSIYGRNLYGGYFDNRQVLPGGEGRSLTSRLRRRFGKG